MVFPSFSQWKHFYYPCSNWSFAVTLQGWCTLTQCSFNLMLTLSVSLVTSPVTDNHIGTVLWGPLQLFRWRSKPASVQSSSVVEKLSLSSLLWHRDQGQKVKTLAMLELDFFKVQKWYNTISFHFLFTKKIKHVAHSLPYFILWLWLVVIMMIMTTEIKYIV